MLRDLNYTLVVVTLKAKGNQVSIIFQKREPKEDLEGIHSTDIVRITKYSICTFGRHAVTYVLQLKMFPF